jgi:hypothetical protein
MAHVTAEVAACAYCATAAEQSETGADEAMNGPITEDEVLEAVVLGLNNGKAASPHTGPYQMNYLLKCWPIGWSFFF